MINHRLAAAAAAAFLMAGVGIAAAGQAQAGTPDVCGALSEQGVHQLRTAASEFLPAVAKVFSDSDLTRLARSGAACAGSAPRQSADEARAKLCDLATVNGLRGLADRLAAPAEVKAEVTGEHVARVRAKLKCDSRDSGSHNDKSDKGDGSHGSDHHNPKPTSPAPVDGKTSHPTVADAVPVGSVATGWAA